MPMFSATSPRNIWKKILDIKASHALFSRSMCESKMKAEKVVKEPIKPVSRMTRVASAKRRALSAMPLTGFSGFMPEDAPADAIA